MSALPQVEVPASLDLLDVVGNGMDCERFLWIRSLSDRDLPRLARIDLVDELQRFAGELLHLASKDGRVAASTMTMRDEGGAGGCHLHVMCREDPEEPVLGDLVGLAVERARTHGTGQVRSSAPVDRPHLAPLRERHGFVEHERWRRFHVDVADAPSAATADLACLPRDLRAVTLAERPDLAPAAFEVRTDGLADTPGDFPRPDRTVESWLAELGASPITGRDLVLLLVEPDDGVVATVELELLAAGSERAWLEFLAVARDRRRTGLGSIAKRAAVAHAARLGLATLHTMNHEHNTAICRLNEQLGWTEDPVRIELRLDVGS